MGDGRRSASPPAPNARTRAAPVASLSPSGAAVSDLRARDASVSTARNSAPAASPAISAPAAKKAGKKTAAKPAQRPAASGPANKVPASRGGRAAAAKPKTEVPTPEPTLVASGAAGRGAPGELPVRPGEDPWTEAEVAEVETDLRAEVDRLRADVASADTALADL